MQTRVRRPGIVGGGASRADRPHVHDAEARSKGEEDDLDARMLEDCCDATTFSEAAASFAVSSGCSGNRELAREDTSMSNSALANVHMLSRATTGEEVFEVVGGRAAVAELLPKSPQSSSSAAPLVPPATAEEDEEDEEVDDAVATLVDEKGGAEAKFHSSSSSSAFLAFEEKEVDEEEAEADVLEVTESPGGGASANK